MQMVPKVVMPVFMIYAGFGCGNVPEVGMDAAETQDSFGPLDGAPDAQMCFGSSPFDVCLHELPTNAVELPTVASTDPDSSLCSEEQLWQDLSQPDACFVVATSISASNSRVQGTRPLVLVATGSIDVVGQVDAAGHVAPYVSGPAAPANCGNYPAAPQNGSGAGGGAGASFRTGGAGGGDGNNGNNTGGQNMPPFPVPLIFRAGCAAQNGGLGDGAQSKGGSAGGAVYLVSGSTIRLASGSIIDVSGGGATAPGARGGGGGGGSGGMLILHAPTIIDDAGAKLVANGGGGASGGNATTSGVAGSDPDPNAPLVSAAGGSGIAGSGGNGAAEGTTPVHGLTATVGEGGGGGGGGLGYIRSNHSLANAVTSPAVHVVP